MELKIAFFIIVISVSNVFATPAYSQVAKVSLNMENKSLEQVMDEIESQSEFYFIFNQKQIDVNRVVNIQEDNKLITDILPELFKGTNVNYIVLDRKILLTTDPIENKLLAVASGTESQQQTRVSGKVTDASTGEALAGVNIQVKGTTIGAISDVNGKYSITSALDQNAILVFSFIGYIKQEIPLIDKKTIDVALIAELKSLSEVVVVATGYGTLDKKEITSAITHISSNELSKVASNDPLMKLQGKVAGLTIQNTSAADPNSIASIQLRGVTTRSSATSPLIVIDGVPGGSLQSVNENDIQSIDVLKDGASSAIYGTRASNGVILITTKEASKGKGQFSYNGYTSFDLPTRTLKTLSAAEFRAQNRGTDFGSTTDWFNEISNKYAFTQKHTVTFSSGNDNTSFRASVDYQNSSGLDIASSRQQYGARLRVNHTGGNGLYNIILNVAPHFTKAVYGNSNVFNETLLLNPTVPVMDPNLPGMYSSFGGYDEFNPVENLKLVQNGSDQKSVDWNATFKLNPLPALSTQIQLAQVSGNSFDYSFSPSNMTTQIIAGTLGSASRGYSANDQYSFEWLTNYSLNVKKHSLKLMGVYSYQYFVSSGLNASNSNFSSNSFTYNNLGNGTYNMVAGRNGFGTSKQDTRLISFRGRLNYSYADKYLFSASITRDGSSKFGENDKWGYFPGVSAGWRISAEPFMKGLTWISDLKIRADYGETGNQAAISNYQSLALYSGFGQYQYNGNYLQVWGPSSNFNPDLRWEKLKNWNYGLDFDFFKGRLSGTINYYSKKAIDLLGSYNAPVPPNISLTTVANVGNMKSNGFEIQLDANVVNKKNFTYNISLNGATQNSVFVSFSNDLYHGQNYVGLVGMPAPGSPGTAMRLQEGDRVGMFYFWKYAGVDADGNVLVYNKDGQAVLAALGSEEDKQFVGNGQPKFTGGMTHSFRYKNWDASVSFRGVFGSDIFDVHQFYYGLQSAAFNSNVLESAYGRNTAIKSLSPLTDYFLEKGDFLKLDVVTISYTFNVQSKYFRSFRLYGSTRNLYTFTKFKGVDPDIYPINGLTPGILTDSNGNGTKGYYPSTTQLLFGVQVDF